MADNTPDKKSKFSERFKLKRHSKILKKHAKRVEGATLRHAHRFLVSRWDKIRDVRYHIFLWMAGVGVLICTVGLQMVWFQQSYITNAPVSGGTYAEALLGPVETLNPLYATSPAELAASQLIFSSLYAYDTTGHIHGDLATYLENKNDKLFTVHLRRDAKWHDGKPLTARDVVFTVELIQNTSARSALAASWQGISVKLIDEYTVQFKLPAEYAAFPQALTFAVLPFHLLNNVDPSTIRENSYSTSPIGSGPFTFQLIQTVGDKDDRKVVYMNANKYFYDGRPRLDRMQLHAYKNDDAIHTALKTGEVTGASDVSSEVARTLDSSNYDIEAKPINSGVYAMFNLSTPALKDSEVRRALLMATDTTEIRSKLFGAPKSLYLPFVNGQVKGTNDIARPTTNRAKAADILRSRKWQMVNGVWTKDNVPLTLRLVTRNNAEFETAMKTLVGQWRSFGVNIAPEIYDTSDPNKSYASEILQPHNYDVLLDELLIGGDPDVFAYWHSRGLLNFTDYKNPKSDDFLASGRSTSNPNLRDVKYTSFAKQWLTDTPAIGLYQSNYIYVHTKGSRAITPDEKIISSNEHLAGVRYWTADRARLFKTP